MISKTKILSSVVLIILFQNSYSLELSLPKQYSVKYFHNFGNIDGFVQIPRGGKDGSSSIRRPEFDEMGIDNIDYPEIELKAKWEKISIYAASKYITFDGNKTIDNDLITHNTYIPKNTKFDSSHEYTSYIFGAEYDYILSTKFKITPLVEFLIADFDYKFTGTIPNGNSISSRRTFGWTSFRLGIASTYSFNEIYKLKLQFKAALPVSKIKKEFNLALINSFNLYKNGKNELNLLAGIEYENFEFRDSQDEMQNFMKHTITPIYKIGLEYLF
ncbi:MAG: hypothetical protein RR476_05355 [Cetobacterium sp.]|uniref:hypothetical protein n=1 Tax=Cetobacterium sp. TaxID=2071632 RepID=UPI002FC7636F